jgi:hypothetical protein
VTIIEITVSPKGATRIETRGFRGATCRDAAKSWEQSLGIRTAEPLTAEFHQDQAVDQSLRQSQ